MTRPLYHVISILFCVVIPGLLPTVAASATQQEALENLRKRITALQDKMERTTESKSEAADALRASEKAISDSNRKLAELSRSQKAAEYRFSQLMKKQQLLNADMAKQQASIGKLLYLQYMNGNLEYSRILFSTQDPDQISRNLLYYRFIARDRAANLSILRNEMGQSISVSSQAKAQITMLDALRSEQATQKYALEKERSARRKVLTRISYQLRQQRREIGHLQRNENRLSQLVERIATMLAQSKSSYFNDQLPDDRFDGDPFDQLKGKLSLPIRGTVTNRFGTRRSDSTVVWKGLFMKSSEGQPVKAIAAGRVVFADWLRGFGNLLIIDHGNGYMSLYGNNETLYKQVGDELKGGDIIATVGNSGGNEDFGLYFELRHESKPLDPMKWLAAK